MSGVIVAFAVIGVAIGAGYLAARFGLIDVANGPLLNKLSFYIFSPALLFSVLAQTEFAQIFSPVLAVLVLASVCTAALFVVLSRIFFRRNLAETTIGATASFYLNSNNFGLPVSLFVIGDLTYFAPVLMIQIVAFLPLIMGLLEVSTRRGTSLFRGVLSAIVNPLILASILGLVISLMNVELPALIIEPLETMAGAAVPLLLFGYGVSLRGQKMFHVNGDRPFALTGIVLKTAFMPVLVYLLSAFVFSLSPHEIFAAVILASLPTAQNIYTYASVFRTQEYAVRDVIFVSTALSLPVMFLVAFLIKA